MELRIEFYKRGMIKFISHLDTIRLFSRAIKRANIPVIWSDGFNPHMKISIAVPLSLGVESDSELMDIQVQDDYNWKNLKKDLNDALPEGLKIINVSNVFSSESVFESVYSTEYDLFFPKEFSPALSNVKEGMDKFLGAETIFIERKRKKGKKRIIVNENIRDLVLGLQLLDQENGYIIRALLRSGPENNLRPDRFLMGLFKFVDEDMDLDLVHIRRLRSFDKDGSRIHI